MRVGVSRRRRRRRRLTLIGGCHCVGVFIIHYSYYTKRHTTCHSSESTTTECRRRRLALCGIRHFTALAPALTTREMTSWAEHEGEDLPPPPPGFEDVKAGAHASEISEIAAKLGGGDASIGTAADKVDAPDLSLKSDGLREEHAGEVMKTIIDPSTPYTSAKSFEDLGLSAELLRGLYGEYEV